MKTQARFLILTLLMVASHSAFAQDSSVLGADSILETIKQAMLPAFNKLSTQAISWLAVFAIPVRSSHDGYRRIRSISSRLMSSRRRSYSWVVRVDAWFAIAAAFSSVPPFFR